MNLFSCLLISLLEEAKHHIMEGRLLRLVPMILSSNLLNLDLAPIDELLSDLRLLERSGLGNSLFFLLLLLLFLNRLFHLSLLLNRLLLSNLSLLLFFLRLSLQSLFLLLRLLLLLLGLLLLRLLLLLLLLLSLLTLLALY